MKRIGSDRRTKFVLAAITLAAVFASPLQGQVPTPESVIGWEPGADRVLADYGQISGYFRQLDEASDRMILTEIGETAEGRPMLLAFVSSPENLSRLDRWKEISRRLAMADGLTDTEAHALAEEGKAIVWIDAGMHATEVAGAQHMPLLAYHLLTSDDAEVSQILEDAVLLVMPVMNPDGLEIVTQWYRQNVGTEFEVAPLPELYHEYVGHDNNRDWFMTLMPESRVIARQLWHEWFPQIVYNHHQTGPIPSRIFIPPFRDPMNPHIPRLVMRGINLVGSAMGLRFAQEGKPGAVSRVRYSAWWNGGMRTAPYFHNQIGILTETNLYEYATPHYYEPEELPKNFSSTMSGERPSVFYPNPWKGGWWRIGDAVQYMFTASMAVADIGAELKEDWLYNIYLMGKEAREKLDEGDPFAYVIPAEQWDDGEAAELVSVLRRGGIEVHRATQSFNAGGKRYDEGSYVAYVAQPFRAHLVDLMGPQLYPDRHLFPGGPPITPYDLTGWTLPMQMGVSVDRIDDRFQARTTPVEELEVNLEAGGVSGSGPFYALTPKWNSSANAVLQLLARGARVMRADEPFSGSGERWPAGTFLVRANESTLRELAGEHGLTFVGVGDPQVSSTRLGRPRVGLYKTWVANMDEGWTRWLFEQYDVEFDNLSDADVRNGDLDGYTAIVLPDQSASSILTGHAPGTMPPEYVGGMGAEGALSLKRFVEQGGTLVAFDHASNFAIEQFGLPVRNAVAGVPEEQFFVPGSLIRIEVDTGHPVAYGMQEEAAVSFQRSRAFAIVPPASEGEMSAPRNVEVVARYAKDDLLMSGWAMGEEQYLGGSPAVVRVPLDEGSVVLIGFRPQFRGQPRGTYKLVFNPILHSAVER